MHQNEIGFLLLRISAFLPQMPTNAKQVIDEEVRGMRKTAQKMERVAMAIAFLILVLFICAGIVFFTASDITKNDRKNFVPITDDGGTRIVDEKGNALVAEEESQQRQFQIFTMITRFGTLLLIIYANSMLFNVFRYLVRTGNYYRARAHALLITEEFTDIQAARFAVLVQAISIERISFGKEPETPLAQAAELLSSAKSKAESE